MMLTNTTHLFTVVNSMNLWDFRENFEIKHIGNKSFVHVKRFHCSEPVELQATNLQRVNPRSNMLIEAIQYMDIELNAAII